MGRLRVLDTDALLFMIQWLDHNLPPGIAVGDDRESGQLPYIAIRSDGGTQTLPWTSTSTLGINLWAPTEKAVQDLALEVKSWIEYATSHHLCQEATCTMPVEAGDSSGDPNRYMSAQITLSQRLA